MSRTTAERLSERSDAAERDLREVAGGAIDYAEEAASTAVLKARRLAEEAAHAAREARERLAVVYDRTSDGAQRAYRGARKYARRNPAAAAALTFATGLGIGLMLAPRRNSPVGRGSGKRMLPIAAIALAHALLEVVNKER